MNECKHDFVCVKKYPPTQKLFCTNCHEYFARNTDTGLIVEWSDCFQLVFEHLNEQV